MAELIYIDTNIYLDYWENRIDKMRPLGEFAYNVIKRAVNCEFVVITSDLVFKELGNWMNQQSINKIFENLKFSKKLEVAAAFDSEREKVMALANERGTGINDATHAVIAKRAGAKYLITRNIKDFENLSDFVQAILPEYI